MGRGTGKVAEVLGEVCIHLNLTSAIQARSTEGPRACAEVLHKPEDTQMPKSRYIVWTEYYKEQIPPPNTEGEKMGGKEEDPQERRSTSEMGGK